MKNLIYFMTLISFNAWSSADVSEKVKTYNFFIQSSTQDYIITAVYAIIALYHWYFYFKDDRKLAAIIVPLALTFLTLFWPHILIRMQLR